LYVQGRRKRQRKNLGVVCPGKKKEGKEKPRVKLGFAKVLAPGNE
jgi:hypothetical protein